MKKLLSVLLVLFTTTTSFSLTFYEQLCSFNPNWKDYENRVPNGDCIDFKNDADFVQAHLSTVLPILKSADRSQLNESQKVSRKALLQKLEFYKNRKKFPINNDTQLRVPVFIDSYKTHCAVGFLMLQSGNGKMAAEISKLQNLSWVKDIKHPQLLAWQVASGFSIAELKLIQGAYDSYLPNAFFLPNKYEIPQKPVCISEQFDNTKVWQNDDKNIWLYGEGENNVLHGKWIQNFAYGIPWIVGHFKNGLKTGQWKEYYQGTKKLCRTENWRNDKLNGLRKRFDRNGLLIEEIYFENGIAVRKVNLDYQDSIKWVRIPMDSGLLNTQIFTLGGTILAEGIEKIKNVGNLQWFQNIELTALNSMAISSQSAVQNGGLSQNIISSPNGGVLFNTPPLVEYTKQGSWTYYPAAKSKNYAVLIAEPLKLYAKRNLRSSYFQMTEILGNTDFDSISIYYNQGFATDFIAIGKSKFKHFHMFYYPTKADNEVTIALFNPRHFRIPVVPIRSIGEFNSNGDKIGLWKFFDKNQNLVKEEKFIVPEKRGLVQFLPKLWTSNF